MWCSVSLLSVSLLHPALGCNGNGDFCNLPFTKYTFAGTHNSNAYDLDLPDLIKEDIPLVDVNNILKGYYENHDLDLRQQLMFGIRAFMVDLCDPPDTPGAGPFVNCHGPTGQAAVRGKFEDDLDSVTEWINLHPRELIVLSPDNIPGGAGTRWEELMKTKFGGLGTGSPCVEIDGTTDVSSMSARSAVSCALIRDVPNDNVTMGALVDLNLRVVVWPVNWRGIFYSTYDEKIQPGATSERLQTDFMAYANGEKWGFPGRNHGFLFQVLGSAAFPSFAEWDACTNPMCKAIALDKLKDDLALDSVKTMSTRLNAELLQDDTTPHEYQSEETCPEYACGCLGYRSPLEVAHQKLIENGHGIQAMFVDYPEVGEKSNVVHVAARMNEANLRHLRGEDEPGADWWSCHWQPVTAISTSSLLVIFCSLYVFLMCRYPDHWGVWFWGQVRAYKARVAARKEGEERGREEARAYLYGEAQGAGNMDMSMPQQIPPGIAPIAAYGNPQADYAYPAYPPYPQQPQGKFQKFAETE
ncbi:unnamed protein product [Symbiodinium sp. CCMP2456]|nr:unnamed protein product [Symbiodinium sp. CCMP2456]